MSARDDSPAFPVAEMGMHGHYGMTLRDYFAAAALAALIGHEGKDSSTRGAAGVPILAEYAYEYADAMLAERAK